MNEEWKIELERAKMRNYILEKENVPERKTGSCVLELQRVLRCLSLE